MAEDNDNGASVPRRFMMFLFLGFILVIAGMIVILVAATFGGGEASFSGVIFVGPFPIVIGAGPDWPWLAIIGIAIATLSIVIFFITRRRI